MDTETPARLRGGLRLVREHLGLTLSVLLGIAVTLKLFVVAHGDPVAVASIVAAQGLSGVLASAFVVGLPLVVTMVAYVLVISFSEALREGDRLRGPALALIPAAVLSASFVPASKFLGMLTLAAIWLALNGAIWELRQRRLRRGRRLGWLLRQRPREDRMAMIMTSAVVLGTMVLIGSDSPWMPRERISRSTSADPVVGYVLADGGEALHVLTDDERRVTYVRTAQVLNRQPCGGESERSLLAWAIWGRDNTYPSC